ncbi:UNVERIFIED_CONTAM: hypothetical protein Sradi_0639500 [Sesamum radiatum]|uniref:Uncharacterized protein n=1 Tax=Sesamum radiatum TaxID=300843 RepID=A0AAW2VL50_SESRA
MIQIQQNDELHVLLFRQRSDYSTRRLSSSRQHRRRLQIDVPYKIVFHVFTPDSPPPPPPPPPPQAAPYMYASPPRLLSFGSQYPAAPPVNDYFVGHVLSNSSSSYGATPSEGNHYTCIGAPVGHGFGNTGGGDGVRDVSLQNQEEGLSWGRR